MNIKGFTLIETLIVVLLIGIFAAIATPSYLSWHRTRQLENALIQIDGALREARHEGKESGQGCTVEVDINAGIVRATTNNTTANCLPTGNRNVQTINSDFALSTTFDNNRPLSFDYLNFSQNEGVIVVYETNSDRQRCLVISQGSGLIRTGFYQGNPTTPDIGNCQRNPG